MKRPVRIGASLEDLLAALGLPSIGLQVRLGKAWTSVVGPLLADKTAPAGLKRGVLTIRVRNHVLVQEMQFLKPNLLADIEAALGGNAVRDIRFVVGTVVAEENQAPRPEKISAPPPLLPDPDGLDGVRDPEFRDILRSLSRKAARRST
jgi:predicted nucleic acid-binding Zn ribbon protein